MNLRLRGVRMEPADYTAAQRLHQGIGRIVGIGLVLFVVLFVMAFFSTHGRFLDLSFWEFVLGPWMVWFIVMLADRLFFVHWRSRRVFAQQKTLQQVSDKIINDEAFSVESGYGSVKLPWRDFYKWKSNGQLILLYQSTRLFNMVPRRWFAQEADYTAFKELLASAIGPENKPRKAS